MIDKGQWRQFGQDTGETPLLFTMSVMGFLMTTESQDLGLTSHPKDGYVSGAHRWWSGPQTSSPGADPPSDPDTDWETE